MKLADYPNTYYERLHAKLNNINQADSIRLRFIRDTHNNNLITLGRVSLWHTDRAGSCIQEFGNYVFMTVRMVPVFNFLRL